MADESVGIKKLIKLRKQRPAFSRMISWELSQAAEQEPVKRAKQKKKKASGEGTQDASEVNEGTKNKQLDESVSDTEIQSDTCSEYETACEDEEDIVARSEDLGVADSESQFESIGTDSLEFDVEDFDVVDGEYEEDGEEEDDIFTSNFGSDKITDNKSEENQSGRRRRRLSKKQKRKKREYFKITYIDDLYNLGNLFDVTDEINDVFTEVLGSESNVEVKRRVPTLVELCMQVNRRKQRSTSEKQRKVSGTDRDRSSVTPVVLPYGMKKLLSSWGCTQKQLENQLSFFLNKVLPLVEEKVSKRYHFPAEYINDNKNNRLIFQKRCVWSVLPVPPTKTMASSVQYASEKSSGFLFMPSIHYHLEGETFHYTYTDYYSLNNVTLTAAMWALATTVDLMLPSQTNTTSIIRVKRALSLRYKLLVETFFEYILPYVMWARGKVAIATDMFKNLIDKETEVSSKAMFLSEIGRMHAIFGDAATAEQFYKIASETALEELQNERRDRCINEVTEQKQVLLASIFDTGVLDKNKAEKSFTSWSGVKNLPTVRNSTLIAGCDAFLCYHLANCSDSKPFDEAISRLEKMTGSCNYLFYYQSMLHALQGLVDATARLYRESRSCCFHTPGDAVLSLLGHRARNPWQPLLDIVNAQRSEVKPLKVIWRTNLQAPRLTKHRPMEGHINSEKLSLRQNEAGHITGDIQMVLPPIRDISLDPYSGSLVIDNIPSHTGTWMSGFLPDEFSHHADLLIPTPVLIYSGDDGTTVHMVKPSNTSSGLRQMAFAPFNGPPCPLILYWTGADGQTAKLNLYNAMKIKLKQNLVSKIKDRHDYYINQRKYSESDYQLLFKFIDLAFENNYTLTEHVVSTAVEGYRSSRKRVTKKKLKGEKIPKWLAKKSLLSYLRLSAYEKIRLADEPFVFGKSIALSVSSSNSVKSLFIIQTEDKASFLSYELHHFGTRQTPLNQGRNNFTTEDYLMCLVNGELKVLNKRGEEVLRVKSQVYSFSADDCLPVIIYPNIIGVNKERNSIWRNVLGIEPEITDIEDKLCWTIGCVYNELSQGSKEPSVSNLTSVGENTGKLVMVNLVAGLGFIDPATWEFVPVRVQEGCAQNFEFTTGNKVIKGDFEKLEIHAEKSLTVNDKAVYRLAIGVQNKVMVLDLSQGSETAELEMICSLVLPGLVTEVCFVGSQVGMLISLTQHREVEEEYYREHVFYFDYNSHLHGVLLCLHRGPRSFLPVYLHGNEGSDESQGEQSVQTGWHVYLRDGRDGIMCVRLH